MQTRSATVAAVVLAALLSAYACVSVAQAANATVFAAITAGIQGQVSQRANCVTLDAYTTP